MSRAEHLQVTTGGGKLHRIPDPRRGIRPAGRVVSTTGLDPAAIRANAYAPAVIDTKMVQGVLDAAEDRAFIEAATVASHLYPKRLGRPEEIAQLAVSILENDYINAECIRMDGGVRMQLR